jgi:hypothetical protein
LKDHHEADFVGSTKHTRTHLHLNGLRALRARAFVVEEIVSFVAVPSWLKNHEADFAGSTKHTRTHLHLHGLRVARGPCLRG